jgi:hypothetical protein
MTSAVQSMQFGSATPKVAHPVKAQAPVATAVPKVALTLGKGTEARDAYRAVLAGVIGVGPDLPGARLTPCQSEKTGTLGWVVSGTLPVVLPDGRAATTVMMGRVWLVGSEGTPQVPGRPAGEKTSDD